MRNEIDFSGAWAHVWDTLSAVPGFGAIKALLGVAAVIFAFWGIWDYLWFRGKRGAGFGGHQQSAGNQGLYLIGFAVLLSAPWVVLPIGLYIVDVVANAALDIAGSASAD